MARAILARYECHSLPYWKQCMFYLSIIYRNKNAYFQNYLESLRRYASVLWLSWDELVEGLGAAAGVKPPSHLLN